jgi:hypothetical protein
VLAFDDLLAAHKIDRAMFCGRHEPGARVVGNAGLRPLFQCGDQRILGKFLGNTNVAYNPRQTGDEPGRFDSPDRVNHAMGIGSLHRTD